MKDDVEPTKILTYPHPVLRASAEPVEDMDGALQILIDDMIETMYSASGIGLAANQIGELKQVIVFELYPREEKREPCVLINPEIVLSEGNITSQESCLSVLDFSADVTRGARIKVQGLDRHGKPVDMEAEALLSICLQHEIDHLHGNLYIDHISSLKRALYKKRLKKMLKAK